MTALAAYEREFRPFMDQVQKGVGEDDSKWDWVPSTQISVFLQKFLMGLASLFEINIADYMISETVKDWSSLITRSYVEELRLMPSWHCQYPALIAGNDQSQLLFLFQSFSMVILQH